MKPWNQINHYAGLDWAKDHHDVVVLDASGHIVAEFRFEHTAEGWNQFRQRLAGFPAVAVAIETNQGAAVEKLLESDCTVYPLHPKCAQRYRERHVPSGNKTDRVDAWSLADALRLDGHGWKPLAPEDPLVQQLRLLSRDEVELIEQRTALVKLLVVLHRQLQTCRQRIEELFEQHPDHELFGSLPGVGASLGPRLAAEISRVCEEAGPTARALQCLSGAAPVGYQSGQIRVARLRRGCNKPLRHAVHLWADLSRQYCPWAAVYYQEHRKKQSHAAALRCLGQRWLKILAKMLQTHTWYDAELHARNQTQHGSWVIGLKTS